MGNKEIFLGNSKKIHQSSRVKGEFLKIDKEKYYKISHFNQMADFFMTIVSPSDHWMYISSNGSLTAGRKNRDNALFPYYTVDKIHDHREQTGSRTYCLVDKNNKSYLWEPFTQWSEQLYSIERNIYKSIYGNKLIFEEINEDLKLKFSYAWHNGERFGWIKKSSLTNLDDEEVNVDMLDGLKNLLPFGINYFFQSEYSNLGDAYKKNELLKDSKLAMYMLSSIPVDRAEPSEALKCSSVWSAGLFKNTNILLSENQIEAFREGQTIQTEMDVRAKRGAYFINSKIQLGKNKNKEWYFVAEVNQDARDIANLDKYILETEDPIQDIKEDIRIGTLELKSLVASADGFQKGGEEISPGRHFSNTLFNIMRGGIFTDEYNIDVEDLLIYIQQSNKELAQKYQEDLNKLAPIINNRLLYDWARKFEDEDLERICLEYLPLTFSRRHGDPSRPWNVFSIDLKNQDGSRKLSYQGNWRDIFQNWEALSLSYPGFLQSMIAKFLNASTPDGYNPYRITREGIDWESPDPHDPWAYIGYWGDHQIIYLQKFLEHYSSFYPGKIDELLSKNIFVFANVPYRIKSFEEIVKDPKDTIIFDHGLNKELEELYSSVGADGKLLRDKSGQLVRANMTEKILVTLLAKLSNFIPEAGIWLNTQRPEWNDANNALVGNGVSMVTLYYLRRFLVFWKDKFEQINSASLPVSASIAGHFHKTHEVFNQYLEKLNIGFSDEERYQVSSQLGKAGNEYRNVVYQGNYDENKNDISTRSLVDFCSIALKYIDQSIQANKREDGLYHSYNLLAFKGESISIRYLYEMLEGQVAILSAGFLSVEESLSVLDALKKSAMFRKDQYSYMLYPDRHLDRFVEKNNLIMDELEEIPLLSKLIEDENQTILFKDDNGKAHFNGSFRNVTLLDEALDDLDKSYKALVESDKEETLALYERLFDHQSFTGRSGTFYGYEGLGSIYWHMVSKLLLATQETYFRGVENNEDIKILGRLKDHYYEIKAGIGAYKSPEIYGAFPTDAYSHSPGNAGVKQPGLTGQVKEDFIARMFELGIRIKDGCLSFNPTLINMDELMSEEGYFRYVDSNDIGQKMQLQKNQLAFTFCQLPVSYIFSKEDTIKIHYRNRETVFIEGNALPREISMDIFNRSDEISRVECSFRMK